MKLNGSSEQGLGQDCAEIGDIDGDGFASFLAGGQSWQSNTGSADIYEFEGPSNYLEIGPSHFLNVWSNNGTLELQVDLPETAASNFYQILFANNTGSTTLLGLEIPLQNDSLFQRNVLGQYPWYASNMLGNLDANGDATATITIGPDRVPPVMIGSRYYASVVSFGTSSVSAAESFVFGR